MHVLRILAHCLYSPALAAVASTQAERKQLICSVLALSWAPAILHKGKLAGGEETEGCSSQSQAHAQLLAHLREFPIRWCTAVRVVGSSEAGSTTWSSSQVDLVWASGQRLAAHWSQLTAGSDSADLVTNLTRSNMHIGDQLLLAMAETLVQRSRVLLPPDSVVRIRPSIPTLSILVQRSQVLGHQPLWCAGPTMISSSRCRRRSAAFC